MKRLIRKYKIESCAAVTLLVVYVTHLVIFQAFMISLSHPLVSDTKGHEKQKSDFILLAIKHHAKEKDDNENGFLFIPAKIFTAPILKHAQLGAAGFMPQTRPDDSYKLYRLQGALLI
jgi:hypothetical protein